MIKLEKLSDYLKEYEGEKLEKIFSNNDKQELDDYIESQIGAFILESYFRDVLLDIETWSQEFNFDVDYTFIDPYVRVNPFTYKKVKKAYESKDYINDYGYTENQTFDRTQYLFDKIVDSLDLLKFNFDIYEIDEIDEKTFVNEVVKEIERVIDKVAGDSLQQVKYIMSKDVSYHEKTKDLPIYINHSNGELAIGNI